MKNERAVKAIQESFQCCGRNTVLDKAWPFKGEAKQCLEIFGWNQPCIGKWRQAEQINAGLLLLVAVLVFILKVCPSLDTSHASDTFIIGSFTLLSSH